MNGVVNVRISFPGSRAHGQPLWILTELARTERDVLRRSEAYRFNDAASVSIASSGTRSATGISNS